jgi:glyceraldehyde-3-phosphate dehydrogenase type I
MSTIRVGINGFGRIGRAVFKQLGKDAGFEVVGINDLSELDALAYLLRYDSVFGRYRPPVATRPGALVVSGVDIPFFSEREPARIPWREVGADIVLECTGAFRSRAKAAGHLEAGAERVIVSAPSDDADAMFVIGVNEDQYDPAAHRVISMASCTTNCLAPVAKVIDAEFGIETLMLTTVHAYTSSQSLVDTPTRKRRRGRAAALSIIPTTTGATQATERVLPRLAGRMNGMALRVPIPDGSLCDIVVKLERDAGAKEVNAALTAAAASPPLAGILRVTTDELVSCDIVGDPASAVVDAPCTLDIGRRVVKVLAWYDNEWGYTARLADLCAHLGRGARPGSSGAPPPSG